MKYTIEGFYQPKLIEFKLDAIDALILRWFIDFNARMKKIIHENEDYYWVKYQTIIDDLPILGITNKNNIARRFDKFIQAGIMSKYVHKEGGIFTYFHITLKYFELIEVSTVKDIPIYSKVDRYLPESREGIYSKVETNNSSINTHLLDIKKKPPLSYDTTQFSQEENTAIQEWLSYKKSKTQLQVDKIIKLIKNTPNFVSAIDYSMANNYQGLFSPKEKQQTKDYNPVTYDAQGNVFLDGYYVNMN
jgi:hypothetical protein